MVFLSWLSTHPAWPLLVLLAVYVRLGWPFLSESHRRRLAQRKVDRHARSYLTWDN